MPPPRARIARAPPRIDRRGLPLATNWTGTVLLVSVKPAADARSVAERVQAALVADQQQPTRIGDKELPALLSKEQWRGVDRIARRAKVNKRRFCGLAIRVGGTFQCLMVRGGFA